MANKAIARNGSWQMTRMNLNTFARHDVFTDRSLAPVHKRPCRNWKTSAPQKRAGESPCGFDPHRPHVRKMSR